MKSSLTRSKPNDSTTSQHAPLQQANGLTSVLQKAANDRNALSSSDWLQVNQSVGNRSTIRMMQNISQQTAPADPVVQRKITDSVGDEVFNRSYVKSFDPLEKAAFDFYSTHDDFGFETKTEAGEKGFKAELRGELDAKLAKASTALVTYIHKNVPVTTLYEYAWKYPLLVEKVGKKVAKNYTPTTLHMPNVAPNTADVKKPSKAKTEGREDAKFTQVTNTLPGAKSKTTSAPNITLTTDAEQRGNHVEMENGTHAQLCMKCKAVLPTPLFDVDHQQAFTDIKSSLFELSMALYADAKLMKKFKKSLGKEKFNSYFVKTDNLTFPSNLAMRHYSSDVDNLNHLCKACNSGGGKGDEDLIEWYRKNELFGEPFLQAYHLDPQSVLARTQTGEGFGKVARDWFDNHHLKYLKQKLDMAKEVGHFDQMVEEQDSLFYEAKFETDQKKKTSLQERGRQLSRTTGLYVGAMGELNSWQKSSKYPLREKSPERIQKDIRKVLYDREKRRDDEEAKKQSNNSSVLGKRPPASSPSRQPVTTPTHSNPKANSFPNKKVKMMKDLRPISEEIAKWNTQDMNETHSRLASCKNAQNENEFINAFVKQSLRSWASFMNGQDFDIYIQRQGRNWWNGLQDLLRKWYNTLGY